MKDQCGLSLSLIGKQRLQLGAETMRNTTPRKPVRTADRPSVDCKHNLQDRTLHDSVKWSGNTGLCMEVSHGLEMSTLYGDAKQQQGGTTTGLPP